MRILLDTYARDQMRWSRRLQTLAAESEGALADDLARKAVAAFLNARDSLTDGIGPIIPEK